MATRGGAGLQLDDEWRIDHRPLIWGNFLDVVLLSNSLIRRYKNTIHWRSEPGNSPHFLRKYFSKSLSFGLCVFGGRQVGSVVV